MKKPLQCLNAQWIPDLALRGSSGMTGKITFVTVQFHIRPKRAVFLIGVPAGLRLSSRFAGPVRYDGCNNILNPYQIYSL
jgi:hypothetical protein